MANEVGSWNAVAGLDVGQQAQQGVDLRIRKRLAAVVVQFNANRGGIDVRVPTPPGGTRVPGALMLIHQLQQTAIAPNQVMGTDAALGIAQGALRLR